MRKSFLLHLCWACCLSLTVCGQNSRVVDSLLRAAEGRPEGERFPIYFDLAFEYIDRDNQRALDFIFHAEHEALLSGDSLSIVKSKRVKGQLLYLLERTLEANDVLSEVLPIAFRNGFEREMLFIEITRGRTFLFHGKYDSALRVYFRAFELATRLTDKANKALMLHNIGIAYYKLKDYEKGMDYFLKSLSSENSVPNGPFYFYTNIGLCYFYLNDLYSARLYVEKSLKDCGPDCPRRSRINIEYALGLISRGEKNTGLAEQHFLKSYSLAKMCNNTRFQFDNVYLLSQIYIAQKLFKKAEFYLTEAEVIMKPSTPFNLEKIKIYSQFSELYRITRDHEKASHYQNKYIQLKDSIYNEELTNGLMRTEAAFLERENKVKIRAQQEVIVLKEEIIYRKTIVNILAFAFGLIMLIFLITILKGYRDKKNMNFLLDQKVEERTRELHVIRNKLLHALGERDARINHRLNDITETVKSIKGLCYLGMKDVSEPIALSYMQKIDNMTRRFAN
jgi:tetratricopeptide (TPR) repeat protein